MMHDCRTHLTEGRQEKEKRMHERFGRRQQELNEAHEVELMRREIRQRQQEIRQRPPALGPEIL